MPPHNTSSWKHLVENLCDDAEFGPPAQEDRLSAVEQSLGLPLPLALREFLLEADGLKADYGSGVVWSASDIEERNKTFRNDSSFHRLYMPFDHLLFIGNDSSGDQFAFAINVNGQIRKRDIFRWDHETDARCWFASRLEKYLELRLKRN